MEKLFRCLDSESYMKGEDPPPQSSPTPVGPAAKPTTVSSPLPVSFSKSDSSTDRKLSEDTRHKEVSRLGYGMGK